MRADALDQLMSLSAPALHPDASWVAVSVTHPSFAVDDYVGQLWQVPLDGGAARRITRGFRDTSPQFSPDGTLLAFLRTEQDGKPQLMLMSAAGGEPMRITDRKLGVGAFRFSPDSRRIAFVSREPEEGRYGTAEDVDASHEPPRSFSKYQTRSNGVGWVLDRPAQVFELDVPSPADEPVFEPTGQGRDEEVPSRFPRLRRLTTDRADWSSPSYSPDGAVLAVARRAGDDTLRTDLWRLAEGVEPELASPVADIRVSDAVYSGESLFVAASIAGGRTDFVGQHPCVWLLDDEPRQLLDVTVTGPMAALSGGRVVVPHVHRGTGRAAIVGEGHEIIADDVWDVVAVDAQGDTIVATVTSATSTGEVAVLADGRLRVLTNFSAALAGAVRPEEVVATAPDGYPVHGWRLLPAGPGPHPVLLMIHGGPYHGYTRSFFDEAQVAVAAGYAVVLSNPRGSWGYGTGHGRAIKGDMGNLDMADVLAFLDHCLASDDALDAGRVGIMGGSYGGYLTAWIIAHDHRFAGAIVERGFLDTWSFVGSSDIGWFFPQEYTSYVRAEADRQSPMSHAHQVRTPTLVIHSEQDLRCPLHQGLQYHALLKQAGVAAEMLVFPGENHELTRSGTPWHRRQRFEAVLDFWGRRLPVKGRSDDGASRDSSSGLGRDRAADG
ncbi:prolyl oligopeptidase family serine peptidase [Tessaracoccus sp. OH4464_COT-324]|uniref:S9 family peptidase n=1 Tax=Tessaracoccus sp. OH4464_COT-324 TaxID=2491059 RepID=UPI000F638CA9|nr:prolyl oligopeptidase family serine peptidase [Tessaracoccus sp. OH4464_COT-324]RRD45954.1 S9 family peptidase [Tessaracoccus sp. OH4464_COT-324]